MQTDIDLVIARNGNSIIALRAEYKAVAELIVERRYCDSRTLKARVSSTVVKMFEGTGVCVGTMSHVGYGAACVIAARCLLGDFEADDTRFDRDDETDEGPSDAELARMVEDRALAQAYDRADRLGW